MSITPGSSARADDFILYSERNATPSNDIGRVPQLESNMSGSPDSAIHPFFTNNNFGGDGHDGDLTITSGTTTLDLGGNRLKIYNYRKISITGTGKLTFGTPHAEGTLVILKSKGDVTITSSGTPCIGLEALGALGGTNVPVAANKPTEFLYGYSDDPRGSIGSATGGSPYSGTPFYAIREIAVRYRSIWVSPGAGGGAGHPTGAGGTDRAGGRGGGALIIECGGFWNFTTKHGISVRGQDGQAATTANTNGGGGGGAGMCVVIYRWLTANSGTIIDSGGNGGARNGTGDGGTNGGSGAGCTGGSGGAGAAASAGGGGAGTNGPGTAGSGATPGTGGTGIGGLVLALN